MEDSRKPLTAVIEELKEEIRTMPHKEFFGENLQPLVDDHARLLALLTPPPDAAVREAVDHLEHNIDPEDTHLCDAVDVILRAVQQPRLTGEQVEAVEQMISMLGTPFHCDCGTTHGYFGIRKLRAAFPEAFAWEVRNVE